MEGKPPSESAITTYQRAMPAQSNPGWRNGNLDLGAINGGAILNLVDNVAGLVALRHCRTRVVTASIDQMDFLNPVHVGELLTLKASVNFTGRTSLEIGVSIEVENLYTGEKTKTGKAYLTFVAIDEFGRAIPVPPVLPETDIEKQRYEEAKTRRAERLAKRNTEK
ncbi:MAG: acyl-CoA thioesterase [Candidatus Kariarchaeaceae archaeon]|jgi:acyl-CoA hydrolase